MATLATVAPGHDSYAIANAMVANVISVKITSSDVQK